MSTRTIRFVLALALGPAAASAQEAFTSANGDSPGDRLGFSVAAVGDVDGDGVGDVIAGAPEDDNNGVNSGSARVLSGLSGAILRSFDGDSAGDRFGEAVAGIGDVDLDGVVDVAVGASLDDNTGADSGSARVFSGATSAILFTSNGTSAGDFYGVAIAGAGDVNADGRPDLIVGTDTANPVLGYVRILSGTGATLAQIASATAGFGRAVDGGADWNGDGTPDFAVGAFNAVQVRSGAGGGLLFTASGDSAGDDFGRAVAFAANLDGDAVPDLLVGAPLDDNTALNSGSVRAFAGATASILYTRDGDAAGDQLGSDVASVSDLNQDGGTDFIAGIPFRDVAAADAGGFRVFAGAGGVALYTVEGIAAFDHLGSAVASAKLVNSDVYGDVVAGAPERNAGGADSGSVTTYTGICYPTMIVGTGCPSFAAVVPTLGFTGCPSAALTSHLVSSGGPPNAIALLLISPIGGSIPISPGCTITVLPPFLSVLALTYSPAGDFDIPTPFPNTVTAYTPSKLNLGVLTVEAPAHLVASKGVVLCL